MSTARCMRFLVSQDISCSRNRQVMHESELLLLPLPPYDLENGNKFCLSLCGPQCIPAA